MRSFKFLVTLATTHLDSIIKGLRTRPRDACDWRNVVLVAFRRKMLTLSNPIFTDQEHRQPDKVSKVANSL